MSQGFLVIVGEPQKAFQMARVKLISAKVLIHYDPYKPIVLSCVTSPYGIGAVLSHVLEDGSECPIAFASCSLSISDNYHCIVRSKASQRRWNEISTS